MLYESIERMWTPSPAIPLNIMFLSCVHDFNECGQRVPKKPLRFYFSVLFESIERMWTQSPTIPLNIMLLCCIHVLNECGRKVQQSL